MRGSRIGEEDCVERGSRREELLDGWPLLERDGLIRTLKMEASERSAMFTPKRSAMFTPKRSARSVRGLPSAARGS